MFASGMMESFTNVLAIPDLDAETLNRTLLFIYTGAVDRLQWESAAKLYYAADKYQILSLKKMCTSYFTSNLGISNMCKTLILADWHQDEEMKTSVHQFLCKHVNKCVRSKEWKEFLEEHTQLAANTMQVVIMNGVITQK